MSNLDTSYPIADILNAYDDLYDAMRYPDDLSVKYAEKRLVKTIASTEDVCTEEPLLSRYAELRRMLGSVGLTSEVV